MSSNKSNTPFIETLLTEFNSREKDLNGLTGTPLHDLCRSAANELSGLSFPTTKDEEWKFTNVQSLVNDEYRLSPNTDDTIDSIQDFVIPGLDCHTLVFVNGHYSTRHSSLDNLQRGVVVGSVTRLYKEHQSDIDTRLGKLVHPNADAFIAANTAFALDGAFISISEDVAADKPILILMLADSRTSSVLQQPRHLIILGKRSEISVVIRSVTLGDSPSLTNQILECYADTGAHGDLYIIQDDSDNASSVSTFQSDISKDSVLNFTTVSLSGHIVRNNLGIRLAEEHSEAHMYGLSLLDGATHIDNHTVMDHLAANCHSNELYKGVLNGSSHGVFNGKIFVRQDAQKTLAYQSNRNILLSKNATINTKPQLEIFADDVKCSHGCTVGQLDEESLFYLRSRGISEERARALLLTAFAEDVTSQIKLDACREFINRKIEQRLLTIA